MPSRRKLLFLWAGTNEKAWVTRTSKLLQQRLGPDYYVVARAGAVRANTFSAPVPWLSVLRCNGDRTVRSLIASFSDAEVPIILVVDNGKDESALLEFTTAAAAVILGDDAGLVRIIEEHSGTLGSRYSELPDVQFTEFTVKFAEHRIVLHDGSEKDLTPNQLTLLQALIEGRKNVQSHTALNSILGKRSEDGGNLLRGIIRDLRDKIGDTKRRYIRSHRGEGYSFQLQPATEQIFTLHEQREQHPRYEEALAEWVRTAKSEESKALSRRSMVLPEQVGRLDRMGIAEELRRRGRSIEEFNRRFDPEVLMGATTRNLVYRLFCGSGGNVKIIPAVDEDRTIFRSENPDVVTTRDGETRRRFAGPSYRAAEAVMRVMGISRRDALSDAYCIEQEMHHGNLILVGGPIIHRTIRDIIGLQGLSKLYTSRRETYQVKYPLAFDIDHSVADEAVIRFSDVQPNTRLPVWGVRIDGTYCTPKLKRGELTEDYMLIASVPNYLNEDALRCGMRISLIMGAHEYGGLAIDALVSDRALLLSLVQATEMQRTGSWEVLLTVRDFDPLNQFPQFVEPNFIIKSVKLDPQKIVDFAAGTRRK